MCLQINIFRPPNVYKNFSSLLISSKFVLLVDLAENEVHVDQSKHTFASGLAKKSVRDWCSLFDHYLSSVGTVSVKTVAHRRRHCHIFTP